MALVIGYGLDEDFEFSIATNSSRAYLSAEIVVCVDSVFRFIYEDSSRDLMIAEREEIINPMIVGPTLGLYRLIQRSFTHTAPLERKNTSTFFYQHIAPLERKGDRFNFDEKPMRFNR